jgi:hypothetical protein
MKKLPFIVFALSLSTSLFADCDFVQRDYFGEMGIKEKVPPEQAYKKEINELKNEMSEFLDTEKKIDVFLEYSVKRGENIVAPLNELEEESVLDALIKTASTNFGQIVPEGRPQEKAVMAFLKQRVAIEVIGRSCSKRAAIFLTTRVFEPDISKDERAYIFRNMDFFAQQVETRAMVTRAVNSYFKDRISAPAGTDFIELIHICDIAGDSTTLKYLERIEGDIAADDRTHMREMITKTKEDIEKREKLSEG